MAERDDPTWWTQVVFEGWRDRPGPRYQRLAAAIVDAIESGRLDTGTRIPSERLLADTLGVSRGTVVACFDRLADTATIRRRQGAGTFVVGRPSWTRPRPDNPAAALLLRRLADQGVIDLSLSVPAGTDHLPPVGTPTAALTGHGLDPAGLPELRAHVAHHLTTHQQLPTAPDQVVVTTGAQQALSLVVTALGAEDSSVLVACPTYPGLPSALARLGTRTVPVRADDALGPDPAAVERAARAVTGPILYLAATGSSPTGAVLPEARRRTLVELARAGGVAVVEDLALADLLLDGEEPPPPLAASDDRVVAIGSASKLLWAGFRVGWVRAPDHLRPALLQAKADADLATSVPSQLAVSALLAAVDRPWLEGHRRALAVRRDALAARLAAELPAWRVGPLPRAGLSLPVRLPVTDSTAFCHTAARHGVVVAPGSTMCVCGAHHDRIRLSYAEPIDVLDLAVERLVSAWEEHSEHVAETPPARRGGH